MTPVLASAVRILVVEDNDDLRDTVVAALACHGYAVAGLPSAEDVGESPDAPADIYVLDLNLPGEDGLSLAQRLRASQPLAGIVMMTTRVEVADRKKGYERGADLYLPKPVALDELLAGIDALMRRLHHERVSNLCVVTAESRLVGPVTAVTLLVTELALLAALARAGTRGIERWQVEELLGLDSEPAPRAVVDARVSRLRAKLVKVGAGAPAIKAIRGTGYRLCVAVEIV